VETPSFDLPKEDDPLELNYFRANAHNLLDECYRQTISSAFVASNSMLMHLALEMDSEASDCNLFYGGPTGIVAKFPQEIVNICNLPDRWVLRRFVDENSHLIHIGHGKFEDDGKFVLAYYVPRWLRRFFFDPNRSRSLYSISWVIEKCCQAIVGLFFEPRTSCYPLASFFESKLKFGEIPGASHLLEHVKNGSDRNELLRFLEYLSKNDWLDIYNKGHGQRDVTTRIMRWVCTSLVG
jgi:hypothetical protein